MYTVVLALSGNAQVNLVTAIAFDRFLCISRPLSPWKFNMEKVPINLVLLRLVTAAFSLLPDLTMMMRKPKPTMMIRKLYY